MCGRSSLTKTEKELEKRFNATFYTEELERYNPIPNYNVAPTHPMPVILSHKSAVFRIFHWGLIPHWAKEKSIGSKMINARTETLLDKAAFKKLMTYKRCIVPMDGFYEWKKEGKLKLPYRIVSTCQEIYSVCGLWDQWLDLKNNTTIHTFTIITVAANKKMSYLHDRMPVILSPENEKIWLDDTIPMSDLFSIMKPCHDDDIDFYRVSDKVNSVKYNEPSLILPLEEKQIGIQAKLF